MLRFYFLVGLLLLALGPAARAQNCDADKSCVGNALTISVTSGKDAQYVDVDNNPSVRNLTTAMSFEAWLKPEAQPGKRQYIAGLWGPNKDANDQWVTYIIDNRIYFELHHSGTRLEDLDNTVVSVALPDMYTRGWFHFAAVWDGASTEARIFIDGYEQARGSNPQYPVTRLHPVSNTQLQVQIGSSNALFDNPTFHRTFKGQIDEIRIWNRALSATDVRCNRDRSLEKNAQGLVLYYRCNENTNAQVLCDVKIGRAHV